MNKKYTQEISTLKKIATYIRKAGASGRDLEKEINQEIEERPSQFASWFFSLPLKLHGPFSIFIGGIKKARVISPSKALTEYYQNLSELEKIYLDTKSKLEKEGEEIPWKNTPAGGERFVFEEYTGEKDFIRFLMFDDQDLEVEDLIPALYLKKPSKIAIEAPGNLFLVFGKLEDLKDFFSFIGESYENWKEILFQYWSERN